MGKIDFYKTTDITKCSGIGEDGFIIDTSNCAIYLGNNTTNPKLIANKFDISTGETVKSVNSTAAGTTIYLLGHTLTSTQKTSTTKSQNIKATCDGKLYASAGFYQSSDERLKDFKSDIEIDFEKLSLIPKKHFTWISSDKQDIGTSAQEIQKLYPEIVNEDDSGYLSVDYAKLSIIALAAIDKLSSEINELKNQINELKKEND